jgi:hypothetical protein
MYTHDAAYDAFMTLPPYRRTSEEIFGIHYDQVTRQLQEEGMHKFTASFHTLFACIDTKRKVLQQERGVSSKQRGVTQVEQHAACVAQKELYS